MFFDHESFITTENTEHTENLSNPCNRPQGLLFMGSKVKGRRSKVEGQKSKVKGFSVVLNSKESRQGVLFWSKVKSQRSKAFPCFLLVASLGKSASRLPCVPLLL